MPASSQGYPLKTSIILPTNASLLPDRVAVDPATDTVWVSQSGLGQFVVVDPATDAITAAVASLGTLAGFAFTPFAVVAADQASNTLVVIDKSTRQLVGQVAVAGGTPDSVTYLPTTNEIAVVADVNDTEYFYNASTFALTGALGLQPTPSTTPGPGLFVPEKGLLYQPDGKAIDVIDPATRTLRAVWDLTRFVANYASPLAFDPVTNTFAVGTGGKQVLFIDADTGSFANTLAQPTGVLSLGSDPSARVAYEVDRQYGIAVIDLDRDRISASLFNDLQTLYRALAVDPTSHQVFADATNGTLDVFAPTPITSTTLYRFFETTNGSHFLTASAAEASTITATRPDFIPEANSFQAVAANASDPDSTPVYRFFDTTDGSQFLTVSSGERDAVLATRPDLVLEGTAFQADKLQHFADRAVYRYFGTANGAHFYTADPNERAAIIASGAYVSEGVAFYAPIGLTS